MRFLRALLLAITIWRRPVPARPRPHAWGDGLECSKCGTRMSDPGDDRWFLACSGHCD